MVDPRADPRTEDTLAYDLVAGEGGTSERVVGRAVYRDGATVVEAPDAIRIAVEELLERAFVDRLEADERPRGYRRSGRGIVEMLIPGMPEHFIARMRGLWLSYPDGSTVTARPSTTTPRSPTLPTEMTPPVTDAGVRRATLLAADQTLGTRPLVPSHAPETGIRPFGLATATGSGPVNRTDCGWLS